MPRKKQVTRPRYKTNFWIVSLDCEFRTGNDIYKEEVKIKIDKYLELGFHKMHKDPENLKIIDDGIEKFRLDGGYDETVSFNPTLWSPDQHEIIYDDEVNVD